MKNRKIKELADQFKGSVKWSDEDSLFIGRCPELFGGGCHGETREEAEANLREAIELAVKWHLDERRPLPPSMKRRARLGSASAARRRLGVSQEVFARTLGVKVGTLRNWEQGRSKPPGPARLALKMAATHPEIFREVVNRGDD